MPSSRRTYLHPLSVHRTGKRSQRSTLIVLLLHICEYTLCSDEQKAHKTWCFGGKDRQKSSGLVTPGSVEALRRV